MSIVIKKAGLLVTVQDLGRKNFQAQGVPIGGAMDDEALIHANLLVGNPRNAACIEMALHGTEIKFKSDQLIAITGKGARASCDKQELPLYRPVLMRAGALLKFTPSKTGLWSYLALAGELEIKQVLGSHSTYLTAGFGGWDGRGLRVGDRLQVSGSTLHSISLPQISDNQSFKQFNWSIHLKSNDEPIRVFQGNEWNSLDSENHLKFLDKPFTISADSNRMGYRLTGNNLISQTDCELISTAVAKGTIQLTPDGNPIVLMADAQTVGGYPRIAHVAAVDLPRLAQKRPGEQVSFKMISFEGATRLFLYREQELRKLQTGIQFRFKA